jgi:hypothetical protein
MIAIAIVLAILFVSVKREHAYGWVIAWALFGIYASQSEANPAIGSLALGGVIITILSSLVNLVLDRMRK